MSLLKAASTVSLLTLASRVSGLVRDLLMASIFGASAMTDAFNVAFRIPNLFRRLFAEGAFSQAFVPVLAQTRAQQGDDATRLLINSVATVLAWILVITCALGVLGAPILVWALASGLSKDPESFQAAVVMTRWMFPYIGFMSMVALSAGILNTWKRFAAPAATPVLLNICMIIAAWWGAPQFAAVGIEPIYAMAGGVMIGGVVQLAVQIPVLYRLGLLPRISMTWSGVRSSAKQAGVKRVLTLMVPALFGVGVAQISLMINTQIASYLATGSVTWLFYADRLMEFPTSLLGVALGVVLTPRLAEAKAINDTEQYAAMLDWGLRLVALLAVPCAVALLTFSLPLVATLFHHGALLDTDVEKIAVALSGYGVGLIGLVAIKVLASGYYASQDIRTPVKVAIVTLVATQIFNMLLVPSFAHTGLALSIGLGALLNGACLLAILLRRRTYIPRPGWLRLWVQIAVASALMACVLILAQRYIPWMEWRHASLMRAGTLALVILIAVVIYLGSLLATGLQWRQLLKRV